MLQEEGELHATGKDLALGALVTFTALTASVSKDGKSEDRRADGVEASSCFTGERRQTCRQGFYILISRIELCQYRFVIMEVLHGTLNDAALS